MAQLTIDYKDTPLVQLEISNLKKRCKNQRRELKRLNKMVNYLLYLGGINKEGWK